MEPKQLITILRTDKVDIRYDNSILERYKQRLFELLNPIYIPKNLLEDIATTLLPHFISTGAKASIRGNYFNKIVSFEIKRLIRRKPHITFSTEVRHGLLHEKADWILYNKRTKQTLLGFNQIDLWSGGHQLNRGSKYVLDKYLHQRLSKQRVKLINVIAEGPRKLTKGTKKYDVVNTGILNNRLFTMTTLKPYVQEFINK